MWPARAVDRFPFCSSYEDDLDWGECFTYTGEGGRDLKGTTANPKVS